MRIVLDDREIQEALRYLPEHVVRPVVRLALNDSGRQGNTAGRSEIRKKWNLKATMINERVKIITFASESDMTVVIRATGRPISLSYFGARWVRGNRVVTRQGVKMLKRAKKGGGVFYEAERGKPGHLPSSFMATVAAGSKGATHTGVFRSLRTRDDKPIYYTPRKGKYAGKPGRTKIVEKNTVAIPSMFEQQAVFDAIRRTIETKFPERFEHHLDRAVNKLAGPP